jgi:hypothetical protein
MMLDCPKATDEEKAKIKEKGAAKAAGKGQHNQAGKNNRQWPTATQWGQMYPGPSPAMWKSWYDPMKGQKGGKAAAASITPCGDPLAGLIPMCYIGEKERSEESSQRTRNLEGPKMSHNIFEALAYESEDDEPNECLTHSSGTSSSSSTKEEESSVPAESREPSESLLTRCAPKLSTGPSSETNPEEWMSSKAARKRIKKKAVKARKASESKKKESLEGTQKVNLNIFNERAKEGLNALPVAEDEWEELVMVIGSGASVPVMPPSIAKLYGWRTVRHQEEE